MSEPLNITDIPEKVSRLIDEDDLTGVIQDALMEQGTIIREDDAREVAEIAFDYIVMRLSEDIQEPTKED